MIKLFKDLWHKLFRSKPETPQDKQAVYDQTVVLNTIAVGLQRSAEKNVGSFIRETVYLSKATGLMDLNVKPVAYVWWNLMEGRKWWPSMKAAEKQALLLMLTLVGQSGKVPNYRAEPARQDIKNESSVDKVVLQLARWSLEQNRKSSQEFDKLASKSANAALEASPSLGSPKLATYFIQFALRKRLDTESWMFPSGVNGPWLYSWVELFYKK